MWRWRAAVAIVLAVPCEGKSSASGANGHGPPTSASVSVLSVAAAEEMLPTNEQTIDMAAIAEGRYHVKDGQFNLTAGWCPVDHRRGPCTAVVRARVPAERECRGAGRQVRPDEVLH